jgi:hypothetical protein
MKYYAALGLDKATLLQRYFMNEDPITKEKARLEILEVMDVLVLLTPLHSISNTN